MHEFQALNQKPLVEKRELNSHFSAGFCLACMVSLSKAVVCYLSNRNSPGNPLCGRAHNCSNSPDSQCGGSRRSIVIEHNSHGVTIGFFVMWLEFFAWPSGQSAWIAVLSKGPIGFQWGLYFTHFQLLCSLPISLYSVLVCREELKVWCYFISS